MFNFLFPAQCILCHMPHNDPCEHVCDICLSDIDTFDFTQSANLLNRHNIRSLFKKLNFDSLWALSWYQSPVKEWLINLKFHNQLFYAKILQAALKKSLLQAQLCHDWLSPDTAVIIPLHPFRLLKRGYNQVAQVWVPLLNIELLTTVTRTKWTQPQSKLSKQERNQNLKEAFDCIGNIENKIVVIIDDIITTGTTVNQLAQVLKKKGAKQVHVWVTCITPLKSF